MNVIRNECGPEVPPLYTVSIPENQAVESVIATVQATDCDRQFDFGRITYTAIGDDNAQVILSLSQYYLLCAYKRSWHTYFYKVVFLT